MIEGLANLTTTPGVYLLKHLPTDDEYVGGSQNMLKRAETHQWLMRRGVHKNWRMLFAWTRGNFVASILEHTSREGCREAELRWIRERRPQLNIVLPGDLLPDPNRTPLNVQLTDQSALLLKLAKLVEKRPIREIVQEAIDNWLNNHGLTPDRMPTADLRVRKPHKPN